MEDNKGGANSIPSSDSKKGTQHHKKEESSKKEEVSSTTSDEKVEEKKTEEVEKKAEETKADDKEASNPEETVEKKENSSHLEKSHSHVSHAHKSGKVKKADHTHRVNKSKEALRSEKTTWMIIAIILAVLLLIVIGVRYISLPSNESGSSDYDGEVAKLDLYVMSQCPYGTQVVDAIAPVKAELGKALDLNIEFIVTDLGSGEFDSLHGENEVNGDIVQLCAMKYNPDKYLDMVVCQNKDARAIPTNWESCAQENDLDVKSIKECYSGDEGNELLSASAKKSTDIGASGSPTIYLNDESYRGGRATSDFFREICQTFDEAPEACSNVPEPAVVDMVVLTDSRCTECGGIVSSLSGQLTSIFPGLVVQELDYTTKEGKELYDELDLKTLPAFLFKENVKEGEGYSNVASYLVPVGDYQSLQVGAEYNPKGEICDNGIDDEDEDTLVDCEDPECQGKMECMQKLDKPVVELFVMSYCPYGTQAEKGILSALELLGDKIDFTNRFVYYAMHGAKEVNEQTLQYCIQRDTENLYLDYLKCFLQKEDNTDNCLTQIGKTKADYLACESEIDAEFDIQANLADEALWMNGRFPLFNTDKVLNEKYNVGGSPTLVINGVVIDGAPRDPAGMLKSICLGFKDKPSECDEVLSSEQYGPGFGFDGTTPSTTDSAAGCGV